VSAYKKTDDPARVGEVLGLSGTGINERGIGEGRNAVLPDAPVDKAVGRNGAALKVESTIRLLFFGTRGYGVAAPQHQAPEDEKADKQPRVHC